jgi:NAD(P)-dependent dehydrogenase (short-subunit alcohol dehydrogenase family)
VTQVPAGSSTDVVRTFQVVMDQFLDLQRSMLPAYVGAGARRRSAQTVLPARAVTVEAPMPETTPLPAAAARHEHASEPAGAGRPHADEVASGRYRVVVVDRPLTGARTSICRDRVVVLTDDGRGVAEHLAHRLETDGYHVVTLATTGTAGSRTLVSRIESAADAGRVVEKIVERYGPIGALVHLAPLAVHASEPRDADAFWAGLCVDTRTLFLLTQAMGEQLEQAAQDGGAAVIACTGIGGRLGHGQGAGAAAQAACAGQGGVLGFIKSLAIEWPAVRVRAVDFDPLQPAPVLADYVLDELSAHDTESEVGYTRGRRVGLTIAAAPAAVEPHFDLPSDAVVLATGGARGITADICLELAERYQPTFVLVGQGALPPDAEPIDTASLTTPADVKRALIKRMKAAGEPVGPALVDNAYRQLQKEREMRRNIGALSAAGARLHYVQLDVRDGNAFGALIDDVYATYGRLDGVLHGAGVIEDKLVRDKPLESFERVLATKSIGAFVLSQRLRFESLRFLVFFSSVAGRFGNRGQADYAAANEITSKLAVALNAQWPARICSIAWAPWDKHGMVSPELKREFMRRGVDLLSPEAGRRAAWIEIQQSGAADADIVIGGATAPAALAAGGHADPGGEPLPLLKQSNRATTTSGDVRFTRVLDAAVDRYLDDHRLDGRPVLPLAVATELMAEAAQATWPDLTVVAVHDLQLLKGIVVDDAPVPMVITVRAGTVGANRDVTEADVDISTPTLLPLVRYRAVVRLAARMPEPIPFDAPVPPPVLTPLSLPLDRAYRQWTFHGPMFQRVTRIAGIGPDALVGGIFSPTTVPVLSNVVRPRWIVDPFVFDAALQLLLIWSRATNGMTALPSRFRSYRRYGPLSDQPLTCHVAIRSSAGGHALDTDIYFVDAAGQVRGVVEGMEASCSAALNRLTARDTGVAEAG